MSRTVMIIVGVSEMKSVTTRTVKYSVVSSLMSPKALARNSSINLFLFKSSKFGSQRLGTDITLLMVQTEFLGCFVRSIVMNKILRFSVVS